MVIRDQSALDYAYNVADCLSLRLGTFNHLNSAYKSSKNPWNTKRLWCDDGNGQEGDCKPDRAIRNADSYISVAAGVWWTSQCNLGFDIPIQIQKAIPRRSLLEARFQRRNVCNTTSVTGADDFLDFEGPSETDDADAVATPACTPFADPNAGDAGTHSCVCSNGISVAVASSTSNQTSYIPCPWTSLPPAALTTSSAAVSTNTPQYQFTTTLANNEVIECQTSTMQGWAGLDPKPVCAGSTAILQTPPPSPSATLQVGKQKVNVGTLTGGALYTSLSSALDKLCPTPTENSYTECATDSVKINKIEYIGDEKALETNGYLEVFVQNSNYNNSDLRTAMINSIARTAVFTANGTNCYEADYEKELFYDHVHEMERYNTTHCNAAQAANAEYFDGTNSGITDNINAYWNFHIDYDAGAEFVCELFIDSIELALAEFAPEFEVAGVELGDEIRAACADLGN